jgi:hypothetical protein
MKKITTRKLQLKPDTVKILNDGDLKDVAGGAPKTTRDLPCIPPPP